MNASPPANAIAAKIVQPEGIPVNDLFTPMLGHPELHSDNVHFNDQALLCRQCKSPYKPKNY